jgi:glyoxylase-like metal-dependent hydrolase (beta-lactamase superfamily II)
MRFAKAFVFSTFAMGIAACASADHAPFQPPTVPYPAGVLMPPEDGYLYEVERVAPHVYAIQSPEPFHYQPLGNVTAVEQRDGWVLIDAGGTQAAAERIIALLRAVRPDLPVKAIAITHWHGDHVLGLRRLLQEWPNARTISTAQTQVALRNPHTMSYVPTGEAAADGPMLAEMHRGGDYFIAQGQSAERPQDVREGFTRAGRNMHQHANDLSLPLSTRISTTETFTGRLDIPDRDAPVNLMFLGRANTDGDLVAWLPHQRVLITGDVVVAPMPYGFSSYPADWLAMLEQLKGFDFVLLIPGHGEPMRDRIYLDRLSALIADVRSQVGAAVAAGLTLQDTRGRVDLSVQRQIFAGDNGWRRIIFDYYWVEPIVQSAYLEARGEPILQGDHPE